jgi:hypothetical protein
MHQSHAAFIIHNTYCVLRWRFHSASDLLVMGLVRQVRVVVGEQAEIRKTRLTCNSRQLLKSLKDG